MMIKKFACGHCKSVHDTEDEAMQCCPPTEVWECDKCSDWTDCEQDYCNVCNPK